MTTDKQIADAARVLRRKLKVEKAADEAACEAMSERFEAEKVLETLVDDRESEA